MTRRQAYKLQGRALQLTQELGALGGTSNSEAQKAARRRNIYRALAARFPNSVKVRAKLKELEAEQEDR